MEAKKKFIVNMVFYGIIVLIVLLLCQYVLPILTPFIIGFLVAAAMNALTKKMKLPRERLRRMIAVVLAGLLYAVVFVCFSLISVRLVSFVVGLLREAPKLFTEVLAPLLEKGSTWLETSVAAYDTTLASWIDQMASTAVKSVTQFVTDFSGKAIVFVTSSATSIPSVVVDVVIMVISTFFMVLDFDKVWKFLTHLVPTRQRGLLQTGLYYAKTMVFVYIKSYALLFLLTLCELTIGFLILGIPNAVWLALIIAVFDLMPILGTGGILLPWALVCLLLGNLKLGIGILVLYVLIAGIRNTVEPKIVGKQIGLHPLATLMAMLLGLRLFGLLGLIGLPVLLTVLNAMRRTGEFKTEKEKTAATAG